MTDLRIEIRQQKPFASLEQEAFLNIERTGAVLHDAFERMLKPHGISMTQFNVLRILRGAGEKGLCRNEVRDRLVTRMPDVTRLLDTRAIYVCPRINPDGAEWALADKPKYIRSSTRPYPLDEDPVDGLNVEDVDGDGRILSMRIRDPNGPYKAHPDDPRLMTPRDPVETGGEYWRVIPEGTLVDFDGVEMRVNRDKQGLDLNRNFPSGWRQEFQQVGSDTSGRARAVARIPVWSAGASLLFAYETLDGRLRSISEPFVVTTVAAPPEPQPPAADWLTLTGTLTREGVECQAMRGDDGRLYTLSGADLSGLAAGDRVQVGGYRQTVSTCQQGTTIEVQSIKDDKSRGNENRTRVVRIAGTLTDEGVECQALETDNGTVYTLIGNLRDFEVGDRVRVVGKVAEVSICQQGTTLEILNIRPAR